MTEVFPIVFQAFELDGVVKYQDLRHSNLSLSDKKWLCAELLGEHGNSKLSLNSVYIRYGISRTTLKHWKDRYKKGLELHDHAGHPENIGGDGRAVAFAHEEDIDAIDMVSILK
jgi:hypothetical protein